MNQAELKKTIHYNPVSGEFHRISLRGKPCLRPVGTKCTVSGYIMIRVAKKVYKAHRLAFLYMTGDFPLNHVDHINHLRSDNRWSNLREANQSTNSRNRSLHPKNKIGIFGVYRGPNNNKWQSRIRVDGVLKHLCFVDDFFEAVCARKSAEVNYGFHPNHGDAP